ncbi:histone deacetylase [Streptomyces sp. NPDC058579]|uniref:histone deacetylase n=1 Tax=Streptomyces sp. NPDC058579 TaxID=3346548 RepID=UPI00365AC7DE
MGDLGPASRVWYASYGSNMHPARLNRYIAGGLPPGGAGHAHPGCRDTTPPARSVAVILPGQVYFATESPVWGGGRGFYDPDADGVAWGVAHLITVEQFSDILAQEMYREPGTAVDLDLAGVLAFGRSELGAGRYETVVCPGRLDGLPLLTFTAPWRIAEVALLAPSAVYLRHLAGGLRASGAWSVDDIAEYLAGRPGALGHWTPAAVAALVE